MLFSALALLTLLSAAPVEVHTLDGTTHVGSLTALQDGQLTLEVDGAPLQLNAADLLEVRPAEVAPPDEFVLDRSKAVRLIDGSLMFVSSFSLKDRQATAVSEILGEIKLPQAQVRSVRLAELETPVRAAWDALQEREAKTDLLVVRKTDALDFVGGVVASVADDGVHLLVNGRDVAAPLSRVFGIVFPQTAPDRREIACELVLSTGDRLVLKNLTVQDDQLSGALLAGPQISVALAQVQLADFGLGRIRYLADLPETAVYKPVGLITSEDVLRLRKNMNSVGDSFIVGKESFDRGLWVHSGTTLKYRLNRDYRRLQAVAGVDRSASGCARVNPTIAATFIGDGRVLLQSQFGWDGDPLPLDLDVSGVRDLEIRIEPASADTIGACEHLVLADARVVK
ncbi:MAG: NPCBM/NEW2 domain-containing protein [Planctomycetaceae bacterium]|nr:NPCBM/NEW2 domain-containing protein [Planctomycetaceae bacterium]